MVDFIFVVALSPSVESTGGTASSILETGCGASAGQALGESTTITEEALAEPRSNGTEGLTVDDSVVDTEASVSIGTTCVAWVKLNTGTAGLVLMIDGIAPNASIKV